ncbi:hypothetical protein LguiA_033285 [Lonicera macranthoides]
MAGTEKWKILRSMSMILLSFLLASMFATADRRSLKLEASSFSSSSSIRGVEDEKSESNYFLKIASFLWQSDLSAYQHVWPELKFGWKVIVGSIIGFLGAAFGSVGGVGGGGIFVPMLTLIIGFDAKSATAISKCMIMGAAVSTVYYNLKLRHPTIDMPIIDYDLALLIQPMLMLGISVGVAFNVIFADWMVTVLLIVLFLGTSTKAFCRGVETWNKETALKKEAVKRVETNDAGREDVEYKPLPGGPSNAKNGTNGSDKLEVSVIENVCWKEFGLLCFVWVAFLALQISKNYTSTCSTAYWVVNLLQIPVSFGVSMYEGISLYKGQRVIASKGESGGNLKVHQLILYCFFGVLAGLVGGLLGLGGGFIMGPLFLELGIPPQVSLLFFFRDSALPCGRRVSALAIELPIVWLWPRSFITLFSQVSSATATFAMMFSSSMSVVEYYLIKRFPVPYAVYLTAVATIAAFIGQHAVRKLIMILGRASLIIFILAFTIFVSAISLGGVGISNMVEKIENHEYMGFENLCTYEA